MCPVDRKSLTGLLLALLCGTGLRVEASTGTPPLRHAAPIVITQPGTPAVRLPLPVEVYARSAHPTLADLRVLDARGERVPYAWLPAEAGPAQGVAATALALQWRPAALFELPATEKPPPAPAQVAASAPATGPTGWVIDTGEPTDAAPAPHTLRLSWQGNTAFNARYRLEDSADLRQWRHVGEGELLSLPGQTTGPSPAAPLVQPDVPLSPNTRRYVRVLWQGPGPFPPLTTAQAGWTAGTPARPASGAHAAQGHVHTLKVPAQAESQTTGAAGPAEARGLVFDLGAVLPVDQLTLHSREGQPDAPWVLPAQVLVRSAPGEPWRSLGLTVFHRAAATDGSFGPQITVGQPIRWVLLQADSRVGAVPGRTLSLHAQATLASLVFVPQGTAPFELRVGAVEAPLSARVGGRPQDAASDAALPLAALLPGNPAMRPAWGTATVGPWREVPEAVAQAQQAERWQTWRPWVLWGVLMGAVGSLAAMVWRLVRTSRRSL